jgi:peptide deformylase
MAILTIRIHPDPILRVNCPPVESFDAGLVQLAEDMVETLHAAPGIGLAAPQVGVELRLALVDISAGEEEEALLVLANPEILEETGRSVDSEGCLSIPDVTEKVARPARISLRAQDLQGNPFELEAEGLQARAICHEVDHLNGVLFLDHLVGLRRQRVRRQLRRLARQEEATA